MLLDLLTDTILIVMTEKPSVEEIGGINIGKRGDPHKPVIDELAKRGISIHRATIDRWRMGERQGKRTRRRLDIPEVVAKEGAARKNTQFLRIIESALEEKEMRMHDSTRVPNKRYGLVDSVAEILRVPPGGINISFRLMRADICLAKEVPKPVTDSFSEMVDDFRSKHQLDSNRESPLTRRLHDQQWDGSMKGFYEILDRVGPPTVKVWVSYELEMFNAWYLRQQGANNLTTFDEIVLENWRKNNLRSTSKEIKIRTGVSLDPRALATHVRMLDGTFLPKIG